MSLFVEILFVIFFRKKIGIIKKCIFATVIINLLNFQDVMKKILCASAFALLLIVGGTSCSKTCHCKYYVDGEVLKEETWDNESGKKCSDLSTVITVAGNKTGWECR